MAGILKNFVSRNLLTMLSQQKSTVWDRYCTPIHFPRLEVVISGGILSLSLSSLEVNRRVALTLYTTHFLELNFLHLKIVALLLSSLLLWENYLTSLCHTFFIHKMGRIVYLIRLLWRANKLMYVTSSGTESLG